MFDVALNWERCPDGVEIHDYGGAENEVDERDEQTGGYLGSDPFGVPPEVGLQFRARTNRRIPMRIESVDLENPLVLRFINLKSVEAVAAFFGRFGLPTPVNRARVSKVMEFQERVSRYIDQCMNYPAGEKVAVVNQGLFKGVQLRPEYDLSDRAQKGRVALYSESMQRFMSIEAAVAVLNDVKLVRCANCNDAFFVGPAAHRRADTKTCSVKCRVALNTKLKKAASSSTSSG